jgi:hypothetical protein
VLDYLLRQASDSAIVTVTLAYTLATIGLGIIAYLQLRSYKQSASYQKEAADAQKRAAAATVKSAELQILLSLFNLLSDTELSKSRALIFRLYCGVYGNDPSDSPEKRKTLVSRYSAISDDVRKVESAFDKAGVLVMKGQVDQQLFFELYAIMVIRTFRALEPHITHEQKKSTAFAVWFTKLYDAAIAYYKDDLKKDPPAIYCDKSKP